MFSATFAYQPIVDIERQCTFAFEALIRGAGGEPAAQVFAEVPPALLHAFDRDARIEALRLASELDLQSYLSLNFLPQALEDTDDCVSSTVDAAQRFGVPLKHVILEITEGEVIHDAAKLGARLNEFRGQGMKVAIDDFGAGYAGLNLLAEFQPDLIKLDMQLVRDIDSKGPRQAIVRALTSACDDLGIEVIAEGVETEGEYHWFRRRGIRLYQGYYFARPGFRCLPEPFFPSLQPSKVEAM